jgi:site-specific recombinase XerD
MVGADLITRKPTQVNNPNGGEVNAALVYLSSLNTDKSRASMLSTLNAIAMLIGAIDCGAVAWQNMRFEHVQAIRSKLLEEYKPATVNKYLSAIRGVLKSAWQLGQMSAEDYTKAVSVAGVRSRALLQGREVGQGEIHSLMTVCCYDSRPAGARDAAVIALLYAGGLRRSEIVNLDMEHYERREDGTGSLEVHGKGHAERLIWLDNGALDALEDWLKIRGEDNGVLFWRINKGGKMIAERMTSQAIYLMLKRRAADADVYDFSPHDLRRTFIGDLLDAGADLATVSHMAGHANVQTTARYDRRGERVRQHASKLLQVPYQRRA